MKKRLLKKAPIDNQHLIFYGTQYISKTDFQFSEKEY